MHKTTQHKKSSTQINVAELKGVVPCLHHRYLVLAKLKKEDAQRIHVFSSFFYKRLNQRERRNGPDTTNLPSVSSGNNVRLLPSSQPASFTSLCVCVFYRIQKKKHNRVKTWTRHVDLFQKDFIFVPINES